MIKQRKSPRAQWLKYNYGIYFVTICTKEHKQYFGKIRNGEITLSPIGKFLDETLKNASIHQPYIEILQYVVMPNHIHAIIEIDESLVGTLHAASSEHTEKKNANTDAACYVPTNKGYKRSLLSVFIGSLKSSVTKYARESNIDFAWQLRYHDHAIRGVDDGNKISDYILNNIANWEKDCFFML